MSLGSTVSHKVFSLDRDEHMACLLTKRTKILLRYHAGRQARKAAGKVSLSTAIAPSGDMRTIYEQIFASTSDNAGSGFARVKIGTLT